MNRLHRISQKYGWSIGVLPMHTVSYLESTMRMLARYVNIPLT